MVAEIARAERSGHMAATPARGTVRMRSRPCHGGGSTLIGMVDVSCLGLDGKLVEIAVHQHHGPSRSPKPRAAITNCRRPVQLGSTRSGFGSGVFQTGALGQGHQPVARSFPRIG